MRKTSLFFVFFLVISLLCSCESGKGDSVRKIDSLDLVSVESAPLNSENVQETGAWFFKYIIKPLISYGNDYTFVNYQGTLTPFEKHIIISGIIYDSVKTDDDSSIMVSDVLYQSISNTLFRDSTGTEGRNVQKNYIEIETDFSEGLLTPVFHNLTYTDVNSFEITVYYFENTGTNVVYYDIFKFDISEGSKFDMVSRKRISESFVYNENTSDLDSVIIDPHPDYSLLEIKGTENVHRYLADRICALYDLYLGQFSASDTNLDVRNLLSMMILSDPDCDAIFEDCSDFEYFAVPLTSFREFVFEFFGIRDYTVDGYSLYNKEEDLLYVRISSVSYIRYSRIVFSSSDIGNDMIRIDCAICSDSDNNISKYECDIFKRTEDGNYILKSRRYMNTYVGDEISSGYTLLDTYPQYPLSYPSSAFDYNQKGKWLYENYACHLKTHFSGKSEISSENLALFAVDMILSQIDDLSIYDDSDVLALNRDVVEDEVRIYFGKTDFCSEAVSFFDADTGLFAVNVLMARHPDISGRVVKTVPDEKNKQITMYVQYSDSDNDVYKETVTVFTELKDGFYNIESNIITYY